jgi:hypothetical protein
MAKLKEVRALKSSGVEPLAPTLIKRILHNLVLKAEDRRWASEIGRLSMLGELTARQTSAAYHVGEIYGRFEWLHGRRRSAASPSYEIGPERPRELAAILEGLCTEDQAVPPGWMDLTRGALEHLDAYFRQAMARARRGRRRVKQLHQVRRHFACLVRGLLASPRGLLVRLLEATAARPGVTNKLSADRTLFHCRK